MADEDARQEFLKLVYDARARHEKARVDVFDVIGESSKTARVVEGVRLRPDEPVDEAAAVAPVWQKKGKKLLTTIHNLETLMAVKGITVRYNEISKNVEIHIPGERRSVDNEENCGLNYVLSACNFAGIAIGTSTLKGFILNIADKNTYNPVRDWIKSKPWDGVSRWAQFCGTLKVADADLAMRDILLRRWMISAVAAAFEPRGVSGHGMLVLQGAQGIGKTFWFKRLVPEELRLIQDGVLLDPKDKDSVFQCITKWMVELGEVDATFRKSDISHLKSFLTKQADELRRPFAPAESKFARRTVFFASVNPKVFLHDDTGNRRFWTLACLEIDTKHDLDMQQVWAEVYEDGYAMAEPWVLSPAEQKLLSNSNQVFEAPDSIADMLIPLLDFEAPEDKWVWRTATELAKIILREPKKPEVSAVKNLILAKIKVKTKVLDGYSLMLTPPLKDN
jgi:putative DNA primase/helicase